MSYITIAPPVGLSKDGTEYQSKNSWWDMSLTRWIGNNLAPIGGWQQHSANAFTGKCRTLLPWRDLTGARHLIGGTELGVFHMGVGGAVVDLTPVGWTPGNADSSGGTGYGGGAYSSGAYGVARPDEGITTEASVVTQDTFGQLWLGCMEGDGNIYEWTPPDTGVIASIVTNAPTSCSGVFVTEQRAVVAYGANGDPRNVAWSDVEDRNDWTPTAINQAGDFTLNTDGQIVTGLRIGPQNLIITTTDAHMMSYEGLPFVYGFQRVGSLGCGAMSKSCVVNMGQQAMWWGRSGFWMFNGGSVTPVQCNIEDFLRINLSKTQRAKIAGGHNADFGEVWWLYPSTDDVENDSYVYYDYLNNVWGRGYLSRLCFAPKGVFEYPLMVDANGIVWEHETGQNHDEMEVFAETGPIELGSGDQVIKCSRILGDEHTTGQASVSFYVRDFPNGAERLVGPFVMSATGQTDCRWTGRQARLRVDFVTIDSDTRFGNARLDVQPGGRR